MLDAREGVSDQDTSLIGHVLDSGRALVIAVNKWDDMDKYQREQCVASLSRKLEFATWARPVFISALHGSGIGELMKAVNRAYASANHKFTSSELTRAIEAAYQAYQPPLVRGHTPEAEVCASGRHQSADHRDPRRRARRRSPKVIGAISRISSASAIARRHADPDRVPRRRKSVRGQAQRVDRRPAAQAHAHDPQRQAQQALTQRRDCSARSPSRSSPVARRAGSVVATRASNFWTDDH